MRPFFIVDLPEHKLLTSIYQDNWYNENNIALKCLITAGDRLTKYPQKIYPFDFYNLYGPTEDTVWTTWIKLNANIDNKNMPSMGNLLLIIEYIF